MTLAESMLSALFSIRSYSGMPDASGAVSDAGGYTTGRDVPGTSCEDGVPSREGRGRYSTPNKAAAIKTAAAHAYAAILRMGADGRRVLPERVA